MKERIRPIPDAAGQWMNVGDVITHANRASSTIWLNVGVVVAKNPDGSIMWRKVTGHNTWHGGEWVSWHRLDHPRRIERTDLCTITAMSKIEMLSKFNIELDPDTLEPYEPEPVPVEEPAGVRIPVDWYNEFALHVLEGDTAEMLHATEYGYDDDDYSAEGD